jgi:hypothetical protein
MGPVLQGTPDPCTNGSGAPRRTCRVPRISSRFPPVRFGSWQGPGTRRTPAWVGVRCRHVSRPYPTLLAQARARCCRVVCGPWHKPAGQAWCKVHTAMQPLHLLRRGRVACHHADGWRALSEFSAPCPIRWQTESDPSSRRCVWSVYWQTVRPCRAARRTHLPFYKNLPLHAEDTQISRVKAQEDCLGNRHRWLQAYILYVPGPTCRGPVPLCMPPFSYKRGGMRRYTHTQS